MTILKDVEVYYVKCDPDRPNKQMNLKLPNWEVQIRTSDPDKAQEWRDNNLIVKLIKYKEGTGEPNEGEPVLTADGKKQWRVNLVKRYFKKETPGKEREINTPVEVVNGARNPIDPNTIGNGSVCNIRLYQYSYKDALNNDKYASILMAIQVKKHIVYKRKPREEFDDEDTETIMPPDEDDSFEDDQQPEEAPKAKSIPPKSVKATSAKPKDDRPEEAY
jgi:hypothetical protein